MAERIRLLGTVMQGQRKLLEKEHRHLRDILEFISLSAPRFLLPTEVPSDTLAVSGRGGRRGN